MQNEVRGIRFCDSKMDHKVLFYLIVAINTFNISNAVRQRDSYIRFNIDEAMSETNMNLCCQGNPTMKCRYQVECYNAKDFFYKW